MSLRHLAICLFLVGLPLSPSRLAADELPAWTSTAAIAGDPRQAHMYPSL